MTEPVTTEVDAPKRAVQAWMSSELRERLDEAAQELGWTRSQLIVRASEYYLKEMKRRRRAAPAATSDFPYPPAP